MVEYSKGKISVPVAVILAGVIIAGSLIFVGRNNGGSNAASGHAEASAQVALAPITDEDHIRGDRNASVTVVEFSDFECPFCARLHPTLTRIIDDFDGQVNWVYRHFPLTTIHSRALSAAIASECVAKLGGNDAFWNFADEVFSNQRNLGPSFYQEVSTRAGISSGSFSTCLDDKDIISKVQDGFSGARDAGGRGTPYVLIVSADGNMTPFSGALPYENIRSLIEQALSS